MCVYVCVFSVYERVARNQLEQVLNMPIGDMCECMYVYLYHCESVMPDPTILHSAVSMTFLWTSTVQVVVAWIVIIGEPKMCNACNAIHSRL